MTSIHLVDGQIFTASLLALVVAMTAVGLWSTRDPNAAWWVAGGVLQVGSVLLLVPISRLQHALGPWLIGGYAAVSIGGAICRWLSLYGLRGRTVPWRGAVIAWMVCTLCILMLAFVLTQPFPLLTGVLLILGLLSLLLCREIRALSLELRSVPGHGLFAVVLLQGLLTLPVAFLAAVSGEAPHFYMPRQVGLVDLASTIFFHLANNGLFLGLMLGLQVRRNEQTRDDLARSAAERSRLEEREHLLAEIHDGLGSTLATAKLRLQIPHASVTEASESIEQCLLDLQLTVDALHDAEEGLAECLAGLRYRTGTRLAGAGPKLDWDLALEGMPTLSAANRLCIVRTVQESITNALKHAACRHIRIAALWQEPAGALVVSIEDDGVGLQPGHRAGRGLSNMERRARQMGANLAVTAGSTSGTRIVLSWTPAGSIHQTALPGLMQRVEP